MTRRNIAFRTWACRLMVSAALVFTTAIWPVLADDPTPTPGTLVSDLESSDPEQRAAAVAGLAALGDPSSAPILFDLLADPDPKVGLYAAQALGTLASPENLPILREGMRHGNPDVRWRTALALGEMGDFRAVPVLARAMNDPEVLVHRTAAESLVKVGGPSAASALTRALDSGTPSMVNAAKNGLAQMGDPAVIPLGISLRMGNTQRRTNSATLLGYIGNPQALPALQSAAAHDPDDAVRAEAAWAIAEINKKNPTNR